MRAMYNYCPGNARLLNADTGAEGTLHDAVTQSHTGRPEDVNSKVAVVAAAARAVQVLRLLLEAPADHPDVVPLHCQQCTVPAPYILCYYMQYLYVEMACNIYVYLTYIYIYHYCTG